MLDTDRSPLPHCVLQMLAPPVAVGGGQPSCRRRPSGSLAHWLEAGGCRLRRGGSSQPICRPHAQLCWSGWRPAGACNAVGMGCCGGAGGGGRPCGFADGAAAGHQQTRRASCIWLYRISSSGSSGGGGQRGAPLHAGGGAGWAGAASSLPYTHPLGAVLFAAAGGSTTVFSSRRQPSPRWQRGPQAVSIAHQLHAAAGMRCRAVLRCGRLRLAVPAAPAHSGGRCCCVAIMRIITQCNLTHELLLWSTRHQLVPAAADWRWPPPPPVPPQARWALAALHASGGMCRDRTRPEPPQSI